MEGLTATFTELVLTYGGIMLFFLLALGIVGLPIPDETLMVFAGWLMAENHVPMIETILFAVAGSLCGITMSYMLGRSTGPWAVHFVEKWLRISKAKEEKVRKFYAKVGKWTLLIGYFFPVVRHLSGYLAGTFPYRFRTFAVYAYTGALLWCATFLTVGYFVGEELAGLFKTVHEKVTGK